MEERVTKIENFLRAGNFVKNTNTNNSKFFVDASKSVENTATAKPKMPPKPKYEGKTQDYWPKLVDDFKQEGKMFMYINLAGTIAKEINDMTLAIEFPNGMSQVAKDFLERPENKMNLKNIIQLASGKEMQIKFIDTKPKSDEDNFSSFEVFANNNDINFNVIE